MHEHVSEEACVLHIQECMWIFFATLSSELTSVVVFVGSDFILGAGVGRIPKTIFSSVGRSITKVKSLAPPSPI